MNGIVIHEFDVITSSAAAGKSTKGAHAVPQSVFSWFENQALQIGESESSPWLRLTQRQGLRAVQVTSFVGVIRAPEGFQVEVLPKTGKATSQQEARQLLLDMLCCLGTFRHVQTDRAHLLARKMPLLDVFIHEFLHSVGYIVKRGIRSDYHQQEDNLFALRGKIKMSRHLQLNLCRRDRFYVDYDEFSPNRPENRLLHAALKKALTWSHSRENQQLARELCFAFTDIPEALAPYSDFGKVRLDRGMNHYDEALAWARLILSGDSPLTGGGENRALSLLFPMEALYEAYVGKHLPSQLSKAFRLTLQAQRLSLVRHIDKQWFRLRPDMLVHAAGVNHLVLDTKWKLLDSRKNNGTEKYGLSQGDFYQLHAYGHNYLKGKGDVVLIYPKTDTFVSPLPVFRFSPSTELRLWVLPFCLRTKRLALPPNGELSAWFNTTE